LGSFGIHQLCPCGDVIKLLSTSPVPRRHRQQQSRREPASSSSSLSAIATWAMPAPHRLPITNCASDCDRTLARPAKPGSMLWHSAVAALKSISEKNALKQWSLSANEVHDVSGQAWGISELLSETVWLELAEGVRCKEPDELGEPVPVALDELEPVALDEPVGVALLEPVPVALDEPVPVELGKPVYELVLVEECTSQTACTYKRLYV